MINLYVVELEDIEDIYNVTHEQKREDDPIYYQFDYKEVPWED